MGWSYGGYMMMWFEGHSDRFAAPASMMGVYDLRSMYGSTEDFGSPNGISAAPVEVGPLRYVVAIAPC